MIYFTSDNHFFHKNIIKYCNRPFRDVYHMNETMISNWNSKVQSSDDIYCIGDFGFGEQDELQVLFDRLQGRKHLVRGNHDKNARRVNGWVWVKDYAELTINDQLVVMFHYAPRVWNRSHHGSIALYGHSHGRMPGNSQSLDVGVDCWEYTPTSFDQITNRLKKLPEFVGYATQAGGGDFHTPTH